MLKLYRKDAAGKESTSTPQPQLKERASTTSKLRMTTLRQDNFPCHNHTSSLLTTSQTRSLVPSVGETMQGSSPPEFFPSTNPDVVFPSGLCKVTVVFAALKYPPGFGFKCLLFISMCTIFMNSI